MTDAATQVWVLTGVVGAMAIAVPMLIRMLLASHEARSVLALSALGTHVTDAIASIVDRLIKAEKELDLQRVARHDLAGTVHTANLRLELRVAAVEKDIAVLSTKLDARTAGGHQ